MRGSVFRKSEEEKAAEQARKQAEEDARRRAAEAADQQPDAQLTLVYCAQRTRYQRDVL